MAAHVIDSALFSGLFGSQRMHALFEDRALLQRWLDYEAALARAQASLGLVPAAAAAEITRQARAEFYDLDSIRKGIERTVHPLVPLIWQLSERCEGDAGRWVHWGATTQDVMDTAIVLQLRDALALLDETAAALTQVLAGLARRYRATPMAGRTHGQQALPVTFGFKVAGWLAELERNRRRLAQARKNVMVGQFGGAVGTLAGMAEGEVDAIAVQRALMTELGLAVVPIAWHSSRDNMVECAGRHGHERRALRAHRERGHRVAEDRVWRAGGATHAGQGGQQHHAAETQPHALRVNINTGASDEGASGHRAGHPACSTSTSATGRLCKWSGPGCPSSV